ncbi:unnamed protein product [Darwinula stevensoni]|uniref:Phosphatidic acid phosphatase type 2/haloperoxidase domain-containing protein n=1 Tax=Darwinula stevensoni TaxID=69355 RepID=A0A7R9A123_9CRUS|nr:unnamed protein product [Darwinula stevensoni]CAG0886829.1 unnamed protein product [Darwinula stevensoni]
MTKRIYIVRWIVDVLIFLTVSGLLAASFVGKLPLGGPWQWGFHCLDPKLQYEFQGDSISALALFLGSYIGTLIIVIGVGFLSWPSDRSWKKRVKVSFDRYGCFLVGTLYTLAVTEILKDLAGMPRPHFFHTCQPNASRNCTSGEFIRHFECREPRSNDFRERLMIMDSYKSFPSGHASLTASTATFIVYFAWKHVRPEWSRVMSPLLGVLGVTWATWVGVSRVMDRRHHWWDVLVGSLLGVLITSIIILSHGRRKKMKGSISKGFDFDNYAYSAKEP